MNFINLLINIVRLSLLKTIFNLISGIEHPHTYLGYCRFSTINTRIYILLLFIMFQQAGDSHTTLIAPENFMNRNKYKIILL